MRKIILVLILFLLPSICMAEESKQAIEKKKAIIQEIMSQGQFKAYIQDDKKFCVAFLDDFTKQKRVEHIKPIVEVDDYNDPRLQNYFKQCPKAEFHKTIAINPHPQLHLEIAEREQELGRTLTEEELEENGGRIFHATKSFKLYKVNMDNDAKNGNEYILYAEGYKVKGSEGDKYWYYTYGGYRTLDLKNCRYGIGVSTRDPYNYEKKQAIENYNGIIKYKGEYYVFDLYKDPAYRLVLEKYDKKYGKMLSICEYSLRNKN